MQDDGFFLSPADVAEALNVSSATVLRLIHAGKLPAVRISERIYRIPRSSLELFTGGTLPVVDGLPPVRRRRGHRPRLVAEEPLPRRNRPLPPVLF